VISFGVGIGVGFIAAVKSVKQSINRDPDDWIEFIVEENDGEMIDLSGDDADSVDARKQAMRQMHKKRRMQRMNAMMRQLSSSFNLDINTDDIESNPFESDSDSDDDDSDNVADE
jgi:hypothetical protein